MSPIDKAMTKWQTEKRGLILARTIATAAVLDEVWLDGCGAGVTLVCQISDCTGEEITAMEQAIGISGISTGAG